ncbi:IclR family transcriptional regulator [Limisalsivibrio acetivorans]|uniref:IclR family transcriptional regulator n=1 Tax=Limisalsivibrio acetivorans TaxID=1304888 RepID=UPI0003B79D91|nr:IclR family transcriptional regulator [Limisalsivibrio acetivorans]
MKRDKSEYAVQAVNNAIDILELLGDGDHELSISDIVTKLNLTRSNVNKLLATLEMFGYVEYNRYTGNFRLGVKTFQISQAYINKLSIIDISVQVLQSLKEQTNESAYISVMRDGNVVYLNVIETDQAVRVLPRIGNVGPAYATATGKAQLAHYDEREIDKLYSGEMTYITEHTIKDMDALKQELIKVKQVGYAIDDEEYEPGVRCVGAPVRDFMGNVISGISVSAPKERMSMERIETEIAPVILEAARSLSVKFGHRSSDVIVTE